MEPFRELTDGVVLLRPLEPADAAPFAAAFRDDPTLAARIGKPRAPTVDEAREQIEARQELPGYAIEEIGGLRFAGNCGIYRHDFTHRRGEVGIWLVPAARGRGLSSRALRLLVSHCVGEIGFDRVEMTTEDDNLAMRGLASSIGFVEEGVMRERDFEHGRRVNIVMASILRREWGNQGVQTSREFG